MLKKFFIFIFLFCMITSCAYIDAAETSNTEISNKYFAFTMPDEAAGTYSIDKFENGIFICEKKSKELGLGGFAFGIKIFKSPKDYSDMPQNRKLGELTDKRGVIYDMVLMRPTEIQYGDGEEMEKNYNRLYDIANNIEIKGVNGNTYTKDKGTKGAELYKEVLKKYIQDEKKSLNKIGYAYYDINSDGIDELFIGNKNNIYDVFAMINRRPVHIVSKGDADKLYVCNDVYICSEYSFDKNEKTMVSYILENNSEEMYPQVRLIYDANKNKKQPWFVAYGNSDKIENISKKQFKTTKKIYDQYKVFNFIPLSEFEKR